MIPKTRDNGLVDHLGGTRQEFTIKANGKAFRTLIDGLYSNKIRAVIREIWSNAFDSHVQAGCPQVPFECNLPTSMNPTFRVRDFGVGLTHEQIMHLYTTLFESSKEDTNDAVGMLGLGSKSPFAYTDTFAVNAYDGKEKRLYVAFVEKDGVPSISHLDTQPCDEPRGLEVSFPANFKDFNAFADEARFVIRGFPVMPNVTGLSFVPPEPVLEGDGWVLTESVSTGYGSRTQEVYVRQGCVIYPLDRKYTFRTLTANSALLIDVPIGSVSVAASREALSLDDETQRYLSERLNEVEFLINGAIDKMLEKAPNRLEKAKIGQSLLKYTTRFSKQMIELIPDKRNTTLALGSNKEKKRTEKRNKKFGVWHRRSRNEFDITTRIQFDRIPYIRIMFDDGLPTHRKKSRMNAWFAGGYNSDKYFITHEDGPVMPRIRRLVRILGLEEHQIISVHNLPDVEIQRTTQKIDTKLEPDEIWIQREHGKLKLPTLERYNTEKGEINSQIAVIMNYFGMEPAHRMRSFTPGVVKRANLPEGQRLDIRLMELLTKAIDNGEFDFESLFVRDGLANHVGYGFSSLVQRRFFPNAQALDNKTYNMYNTILEMTGSGQDIRDRVEKKFEDLSNKYPLLFSGSESEQAAEEYIDAMEAR